MNSKKLIVIVGATASGKTDLSLRLARHYGAPILSADSRQVFRGMPIGTAQPTAEELQQAEHHFIAELEVDQDFSCGRYEVEALARLEELFRQHDTVVAVGGSGLYVQALCRGMDSLPQADPALRERLTRELQEQGVEAMADRLRTLDPVYYAQVDRQNPARVLRAVEVCLQTGRPFSEQRTGARTRRDFRIIQIGTEMAREVLYERIDCRVEQMIAAGLEAEVRTLYPHRALNALQTVGYKELFDWFDGRCTRQEAIEAIQRNTRRYAKRQLTWFRRDPEIRWFEPHRTEEIVAYIDAQDL